MSVPFSDEAFRRRLAELLDRSGLSRRQLSLAFGRDPGYVAALLDPARPSRSRPTPADMLKASDALAIPFVDLLEALWDIDSTRLAAELRFHEDSLSAADQKSLNEYGMFLRWRRRSL